MNHLFKWTGPKLFGLALILLSGTLMAQSSYKTPGQINDWCTSFAKENSQYITLKELAKSPGGQSVMLLEICSQKDPILPAVLVVANMNGLRPISSEGAIFLAKSIIDDPAKLEKRSYYIIPCGNPDAAGRYFDEVKNINPGNDFPTNDDLDEQTDEDGNDDLNGDGYITMMRVKHPEGTMIIAEDEPRLLRKANIDKGETGIYKIYTEGLDNDGDGKYNEDGPGGTNVNLNFPHLFKHFDPATGLYPGSTPESRALFEYVFDHPEIAMAFALGETNFCVKAPAGGRKGDANLSSIKIPDNRLERLNAEKGKSYTMNEVIEMIKPLAPDGIEITPSIVASFLGLGAAVNPMDDDLKFYKKFAKDYKAYLEEKGVKDERFDPAKAKDGSFELWAYYHLGIPIFSLDLFSLNKVKEENKQSESGITNDSIPEKKNVKQKPKEKEEVAADPKEKAMLAFSDKVLDGKGFIEWEKYTHPTLGEVEIGGFVPYMNSTPPFSMVDSLLSLQLPWVFELADKLPELAIYESKVIAKGAGIYQLEIWVENKGFLPYPIAIGKRNEQPYPVILTLEGKGIEFLEGKKRTSVNAVPGNSKVKKKWLIKVDKPADINITISSPATGKDTKTVKIGG